MDEYCKLQSGEIFEDFNCLLNLVDGKSDKFYCIQVLKNKRGFHVWTRWGRNGTEGQSKLEGPISQADAEKNFKKKFLEKTKNAWNKRHQFATVKGKYELVEKNEPVTESKTSQESTFSVTMLLPQEVLYSIFLHLSVQDVLRCVQVCLVWKNLLSEESFWKMYLQKHFDLGIQTDLSCEGLMAEWSDPDSWYCYFNDDDSYKDIYVMRPFPSMWNCRVVHPYGLNPLSGDVRSLQGLSRSLEILTYMRSESARLGMACGNQCSASESSYDIGTVIFPWEKTELPTPIQLLKEVFHFHPAIFEYYEQNPGKKGELRQHKLHFHTRPDNVDDSDYDEDEDEHDVSEQPCLNRIFGMCYPHGDDERWIFKASQEFYAWLQPIMYPCVTVYAGEDKLNPVAVFMLTQLAPGWVGGALTAVIYT